MTEEQADKIINLLEKIVSNTRDTARAVEALQHIKTLDDLDERLLEVIVAIENTQS